MGSSNSVQRRRFRLPRLGDVVYAAAVVILCSASAAFPFYVYFNEDQFGPPVMRFYGAGDAAAQAEADAASYQRKVLALVKPRLELDRITTGTVFKQDAPVKSRRLEKQPMPPVPDEVPELGAELEIMFVSQGRAIAISGGRVVSLREGSLLTDGSLISSIGRADDGWVVSTSSGKRWIWLPGS